MNIQLLDDNKIWINFISYADRLFSEGRDDLWSNPDTFISIYSQGQRLIRSDILGIPVREIYLNLLNRDEEIYNAWVGRKSTYALKKLLALQEPKQYLKDVLSGLQNLYQESIPLVLFVSSPETWIRDLHEKLDPSESLKLNNRMIESSSMYLAEFLRNFSTLGLSAIVIVEDEESNALNNVSYYEPMINLSNHYKWLVGLEVHGAQTELESINDRIDFILLKESNSSTIQSLRKENIAVGGGLDRGFWVNGEKLDNSLEGLTYGEIPRDAHPEKVLSQIEKLRE